MSKRQGQSKDKKAKKEVTVEAGDGPLAEQVPRQVSVTDHNCAVAWTPFPVTVMKPFAPFLAHSDPFVSKSLWREPVSGIKALKRLKLDPTATAGGGGAGGGAIPTEVKVATGHTLGHLMVLNGDNYQIMQKVTHYNNVTITDLVISHSMVFTLVEREPKHGTASDDSDVFVWDISTFELICQLSGHEDRVTSIALDEKDERRVATGGVDKAIYLWHVDPTAAAKEQPQPLGKLSGHQMSVTKLLISGTILVSSSADSTVRIWDLDSKSMIREFDGHQGSVKFLSWAQVPTIPDSTGNEEGKSKMSKKQRRKSEDAMLLAQSTSPAAMAENALKAKDDGAVGYFVSACASGIIRYYAVEGHHVVMHWTNKAHKGMTTDVVWDSDVVVSSSASDGVNFYNLHQRRNTKYAFADGVRQLAMDKTRKLVLAGADSGQLCILNYSGLVNPSAASEGLSVFTTIQPHQGSITNLVLERSGNGQWERVITASIDRTIFVLDFDVDRDSKTFSGHGGPSNFGLIPETGTMITGSDSHCPVLWDPVEMMRKTDAKKNQLLQNGHQPKSKILCMQYAGSKDGNSKLVTGADDGQLRVWDIEIHSDGVHASTQSNSSSRTAATTNKVNGKVEATCGDETISPGETCELGASIKCMSDVGEGEHLVAVGLHKGGSAGTKVGSVAVVNIHSGIQVGSSLPTVVYPVVVRMHNYTHPESKLPSFVVIAQLRDGAVVLFAGNDDNFIVLRTIVSEHFSYSIERDMESGHSSPWPVPLRTRLHIHAGVARVESLLVDETKRVLKCIEVTTHPKDTSTNTKWKVDFEFTINKVQEIGQGNVFCAVATEHSNAYIVSNDGEILYDIHYDGAVYEPSKMQRGDLTTLAKPRAPTSFQTTTSLGDRLPGCATIAESDRARVVVFGYRDGLIQLWDVTQRKVCRRIHAHNNAIAHCWILPNQLRLASVSVAGNLRFDTIYQRNVRDSGGDGAGRGQFTPPTLSRSTSPIPPEVAVEGKEKK